MIPALGDVGDRILKEFFEKPEFLERIATFLVVANCCPPFALSRKGVPVLSIGERRQFFAMLSEAFVQAALLVFRPRGEIGAYVFKFPDAWKKSRFLAYLRLMDAGEVAALDLNKRAPEQSLKTLARDVIGVTEFLFGCLEFKMGATYDTVGLSLPS